MVGFKKHVSDERGSFLPYNTNHIINLNNYQNSIIQMTQKSDKLIYP